MAQRRWTPAETQCLLTLIADTPSRDSKLPWKVIEKGMAANGYARNVDQIRNHFLRLKEGAQGGGGKNHCRRCGQLKKGHICTASDAQMRKRALPAGPLLLEYHHRIPAGEVQELEDDDGDVESQEGEEEDDDDGAADGAGGLVDDDEESMEDGPRDEPQVADGEVVNGVGGEATEEVQAAKEVQAAELVLAAAQREHAARRRTLDRAYEFTFQRLRAALGGGASADDVAAAHASFTDGAIAPAQAALRMAEKAVAVCTAELRLARATGARQHVEAELVSLVASAVQHDQLGDLLARMQIILTKVEAARREEARAQEDVARLDEERA